MLGYLFIDDSVFVCASVCVYIYIYIYIYTHSFLKLFGNLLKACMHVDLAQKIVDCFGKILRINSPIKKRKAHFQV